MADVKAEYCSTWVCNIGCRRGVSQIEGKVPLAHNCPKCGALMKCSSVYVIHQPSKSPSQ